MKTNFEKLVDMFWEIGDLGHANEDNYSICLYNVPDTPKYFEKIKRIINSVTTRYKFIPCNHYEGYCNVQILDIDL